MTHIPAGWKLVPIEPTDEMETAAENDYEQRGETFPDWKAKYRAMLAAAPAAPSAEQDAGAQPVAWMDPDTLVVVSSERKASWLSEYGAGGAAKAASYTRALGDIGAPAAGDARDEPVPEWVACESRRPWVTNSLKANAQEMREKEKRCRTAFNKDFMGMPSRYVADAYAEAAAVFEAKLAAIAAQRQRDAA